MLPSSPSTALNPTFEPHLERVDLRPLQSNPEEVLATPEEAVRGGCSPRSPLYGHRRGEALHSLLAVTWQLQQ